MRFFTFATPVLALAAFAAAASLPATSSRLPAPVTTAQLLTRLTAAVDNLRTLRLSIAARERIGSKYMPAFSTAKINTSPLRLYLKNQAGVEVLYATGENSGDAWVYPGSFPYVTLSLDPLGSMMRRNQHHTALQIGFGVITGLLQANDQQADQAYLRSFRYVGDSLFQRRACYVLRSDFPRFRYVATRARLHDTPATVAARFGCGEYRVLERNHLSPSDHLTEGQALQVPNAYGSCTVVLVDPQSFLPASVSVFDDRGLYERYEFSNVVANQPIAPAEFTKGYKDYKL